MKYEDIKFIPPTMTDKLKAIFTLFMVFMIIITSIYIMFLDTNLGTFYMISFIFVITVISPRVNY